MGKNCLVKRYKAVTNNPNLPILEVMQQFTLDAIAASGNASLTDDQKWALNHFFYQLGKFDESGLWSKFTFIMLPILASQVDHACIDYIDNTNRKAAGIQYASLVNKGIAMSANSYYAEKTIGAASNTDFSIFMAVSQATNQDSALINVTGTDAYYSGVELYLWQNIISQTVVKPQSFGFSGGGADSPFTYANNLKPSVIKAFSVSSWDGSSKSGIHGAIVEDGKVKLGNISIQPAKYVAFSVESGAKVFVKGSASSDPMQMVICGKGMTEAELVRVTNAVNDLRNALYTE
jgi:hypothetical protein